MVGDGSHGKCCVEKSIHNALKFHNSSHKAYALIGDLDSLQIGGDGETTYSYSD